MRDKGVDLHSCCVACPRWNFFICFWIEAEDAAPGLQESGRAETVYTLRSITSQFTASLRRALMNCSIGSASRLYDGLLCDVPARATSIVYVAL